MVEEHQARPKDTLDQVAVVGKYVDLQDSYISVKEALLHAGLLPQAGHRRAAGCNSEDVEQDGPDRLPQDSAVAA